MRKVYKKRDEDAVSPVIATILMVAITVVLAAVLYVMVIGFGEGGDSTPAGQWKEVKATSNTEGKLTFGQFTTTVQPMDIKLFISENGTAIGEITWSSNTDVTAITWTGGATVAYFDYAAAEGEVNSGDYVTLSALNPDSIYVIEVFHIDTGATISMTGDSGTFSTPP